MVTVTMVITGNCVLNAYWAVRVKLHKTRTIIIVTIIIIVVLQHTCACSVHERVPIV